MFIERRFYNACDESLRLAGRNSCSWMPRATPGTILRRATRGPATSFAGDSFGLSCRKLGGRCGRAGAERKALLKEGVRVPVLAEREHRGWRFPSEKVLEVFVLGIELNAQGVESWLDAEGK